MRQLVRSLVLLVAIVSVGAAQQPAPTAAPAPPADQLARANALFAQSDWPAVFTAYDALVKSYPAHAASRLRLGVAQLELGRLAEAESNFREAERLGGIVPGAAAYRLAQLRAAQKQPEEAIKELERSAAARFSVPLASLNTDRHLAALRTHPKWQAVLNAYDAITRPCMHDARYRQFDYWVGDWDVRPTGTPLTPGVARNTITIEENGCVIMEHWNPPGGGGGQSYNIFDRTYGKWRQTWVDRFGGQHDYRGGPNAKGDIEYIGDMPGPGGRVPVKVTFFNLGKDSLRQYSEVSRDSGKTWVLNYDLMYTRRKQQNGSTDTLTAAARSQILALDSAFVRGWLRDDTTAVLNIFAADAVLQPPNVAPVTGHAAIRAYWWPSDGSRTKIRAFEHRIVEMIGSSTFAIVRGTSTLQWSYTKDGKTTENTSRSNDLRVYAMDAAGSWRVIRQAWTAMP
jgi:ketosteroid isomerase-like protein